MTRKDPLERLATRSPLKFDAELFSTGVYKGQPRKELDEAWKKIVDRMCPAQLKEMPIPMYIQLRLSTDPMVLANYRTLQAFDATTKPTKGVGDHYYATVEVFHHLHCLDITRKFIWRDHYHHVDTFQNPPDIVWKHVGKSD